MALFHKNRRTEKFKEFIMLETFNVPGYYPLVVCERLDYTEKFLGPVIFNIHNSNVFIQDKANLIIQLLVAYEYLGGTIPEIIYRPLYSDGLSLEEFKELAIKHLQSKLVDTKIVKESLEDIMILVYDTPSHK